jgi:membrane-associated protein
MDYRRFMAFNISGGIAWVVLILPAGWFLGQFEFVKKRFELIVIGIIVLSVLPVVFEWWKARKKDSAKVPGPGH